jgi:mannose-1-phosphate guanylyltransferase
VRLRPYTTSLPKPLVPLGDECAILEVVLHQLASAGVESVSIAIGHLGQLIRAVVGDGARWGLDIEYWEEESPLGTVGPLVQHRHELPEDFLVLNGDILTDIPFGEVLRHHEAAGADVTVAAYTRAVQIDFGVLELTADADSIVGFREKPTLECTVSMGVYAMAARVLDRFEPGLPLGFDDLLLDQLSTGNPPQSYCYDGFWLDIGRPEDYDRANAEFPLLRAVLIPERTPAIRRALAPAGAPEVAAPAAPVAPAAGGSSAAVPVAGGSSSVVPVGPVAGGPPAAVPVGPVVAPGVAAVAEPRPPRAAGAGAGAASGPRD